MGPLLAVVVKVYIIYWVIKSQRETSSSYDEHDVVDGEEIRIAKPFRSYTHIVKVGLCDTIRFRRTLAGVIKLPQAVTAHASRDQSVVVAMAE